MRWVAVAVEFRLLGDIEARIDDRAVDVGHARQRCVLAVLLVGVGRSVSVDQLVERVWGEQAPQRAQAVLYSYVSRLRRALVRTDEVHLERRAGGYLISADPLTVDLHRFHHLVAVARTADDDESSVAVLEQALGLWRGEAFGTLDVPWLNSMREAAHRQRLAAELDRNDIALRLGRHTALLNHLLDAVTAHPLDERLAGQLMLALYRSGRQADALEHYQQVRLRLADELGTDPSPPLRQLYQQILTADPALTVVARTVAAVPPGQPPAPADSGETTMTVTGPGEPDTALPHPDQQLAGSLSWAAVRALPRDIAAFTGRQAELHQLTETLTQTAASGGVVGIHAIGGMAGIGKTTFAVHAAHQLADRFPAGQIFLPLHGHTPGQRPVDPADALASLLLTAGLAAPQIPPGLEARAARWRDLVAGKQILLVLDDAAGHDQVRPLLPGSAGSLVLITSRRHLTALDDATTISLDTLPPDQAAALLVRLAARPGLSPSDPAVAELTRLCGFLPLAIGMVARQLHHHPAWSPARRAAELADAVDRLELIATENLSVAAAFNLSYADLTEDQQRLFRRLGLHPGTDIDGYAAAALNGTDLPAARRGLDALYDQYLLTEPGHGRYRPHDLIREHAHALTDRLDPEPDRNAATARLLDYYQHTAARADALIARLTRPGPAPTHAGIPAAAPALADPDEALAWLRTERASLLACLDHATATGQHARVIALTAGLAELLRRDGPWPDAITRHTAAIRAAQRLGDRVGQAGALTDLGFVRRLTNDYPAAVQALEQALDIYRDLGDRLGQASALIELGEVRRMTSDDPAAAQALEQALDIYRDLGDRLGQASALNIVGEVRRLTGDYPAAAQDMEQALDIYRDLGDRLGQARALHNLGTVGLSMGGDYRVAAQCIEQALRIYRDLGDRFGEATALVDVGNTRVPTGDYRAAAQDMEQALDIYRELGNRHGEANALLCLGVVRRLAGDHLGAARVLEQALDTYRELGDRGGETEALNQRGTLYRIGGHLGRAHECHQQALDLARAFGWSWDEAHALAGLGRCALATGHATQAAVLLRQALESFQRIGAAEAADLRAELASCAGCSLKM